MDITDRDDTLLVVTADHSHVFTVGGDARVDTPVFGKYMFLNVCRSDNQSTTNLAITLPLTMRC